MAIKLTQPVVMANLMPKGEDGKKVTGEEMLEAMRKDPNLAVAHNLGCLWQLLNLIRLNLEHINAPKVRIDPNLLHRS